MFPTTTKPQDHIAGLEAGADAYLAKPKDVVPGTKMSFNGLSKEADREAVIFYLAQHAATPISAAVMAFVPLAVSVQWRTPSRSA